MRLRNILIIAGVLALLVAALRPRRGKDYREAKFYKALYRPHAFELAISARRLGGKALSMWIARLIGTGYALAHPKVLREIRANIALLDPRKATWKNAARVCIHQALNFREYAELGVSNTGVVLDMLGSKQGIEDGMAVICPQGVVGVIINTSDNYARGMSVLNSKFEITPYLPSIELRQGVIGWSGMDYHYAELREVNRTEQVKKGMTVVTSNYSSIFPPNIPIGKVHSVSLKNKSNFHQITLKLATDFNRLNSVYCVKNNYHIEIDSLSNPILDLPK